MKIYLPLCVLAATATISCSNEPTATTSPSASEASSETAGTSTRKPYKPMSNKELRKKLTKIQYQVTMKDATERPWTNKYDKHFDEGIYVSIVSGVALFSSQDKYDSGCGWPAFTKPINAAEIVEKSDKKLASTRTEVRAKTGDSHLGHVFTDGPQDKGGLRYCINSASLRFVPKSKLLEEGYGEYLKLFAHGDQ